MSGRTLVLLYGDTFVTGLEKIFGVPYKKIIIIIRTGSSGTGKTTQPTANEQKTMRNNP